MDNSNAHFIFLKYIYELPNRDKIPNSSDVKYLKLFTAVIGILLFFIIFLQKIKQTISHIHNYIFGSKYTNISST
ncbi:hypothetical protein HZS_2846 [Henneguya salminicola]|nr:hypothetical protein HZS_2846 [Henneguya salminicola]